MSTAIYAGSFDPITRGHFDIIEQALRVFDKIIIGIGTNPNKQRLFSMKETQDLIVGAIRDRDLESSIDVKSFSGALVHFAEQEKATAIVRGLRQVSDFNDEFTQHGINSHLSNIPIVYMICHTEYLHVSSSSVKQMASLTLDISWLVDKNVETALRDKYSS